MSVRQNLTLKLLQSYYPVVITLNQYLRQICELDLALENSEDLDRYVSLVRTSYVALSEPPGASTTNKFHPGELMCEMYEVIDRVQVRLFEQAKGRPLNVLTMGYRRADRRGEYGRADMSRQAITNFFPNTNITALQELEWKILLTRIGEAAMCHLLLNTNIFVSLPNHCFCQLVGTPITELKPLSTGFVAFDAEHDKNVLAFQTLKGAAEEDRKPRKRRRLDEKDSRMSKGETTLLAEPLKARARNAPNYTPTEIILARVRIFYARPVIVKDDDSGIRRIAVGLPPNHVLNRLAPIKPLASGGVPSKDNIAGRDTRHVLKHVFPRQFGLDNPFHATKREDNAGHKFKDYTVRDEDIEARGNVKTPKRLKPVQELVHQLIKRHWACNYRSYRAALCPSKILKVKPVDRKPLDTSVILEMMSETPQNQTVTQVPLANLSADSHPSMIYEHGASFAEKTVISKPKFAEFICSHNEVFRYVLKVTTVVIPKAFWGCQKNFKAVMKHVERLVKGRRYETMTLHSVLQDFSTQECDWLLPENPAARHQRPSISDALKRHELVSEFLYWYFDSFVIPLLKTTFYATDSNAFRYQVLYFRQDDWASLCRPLLDRLAQGTFERIDEHEAQDILRNRKLGYSFVRLLPKETGVRPIVNLRRKSAQRQPDGSPAQSINQIMQAAFQILTYEKNTQPSLLGASVFGTIDTYAKLKSFKTRLLGMHGLLPKLYFVKADVKTCFDSIEQGKLLEILHKIILEDGYMIQRYSRVMPVAGKITRSFRKQACPEADHPHFLAYAAKLAGMLGNAIFIDQVVYSYEDREEILQLLKEHVTENIVKIGQHFYRQTVGIPQGSVLSTILCSFFYGDLETKFFKFTEDIESMLCRFIDDYLFVTTEESKARNFLDMMNAGHPEYGCFISSEKTLTNFDTDEGVMNRTQPGQKEFPWCGYLIDMEDLSVSADYIRYAGAHIGDTVTVDRGRNPGAAFMHKMLHMAKHRSHVIFCDATLNNERVVHRNVYQNFLLAAMKMHCYVRDWGVDLSKKSVQKFILSVIHKMIRFSYISSRSKALGYIPQAHGAKCNIKEVSVIWLGTHAFWTVLGLKNSGGFAPIVRSLEFELRSARFMRSETRWRGMVKEARGMLECIKF